MQVEKLFIAHNENVLVDISFEIKKSLALVGQSGSGKSLTLKALLGMLPDTMQCTLKVDSQIDLDDEKALSFVPQNPFTALSPLTKIKKQFFLEETRIKELFDYVELDYALMDRFAPELSGGQLQRVVLALALSHQPKLILLDEPTTALDPKTRVVIIELLKTLQDKLAYKMLFVTHDMHSAQSLCEDICVIKEGKVMEQGNMIEVTTTPKNEYTQALLEANFAQRQRRK